MELNNLINNIKKKLLESSFVEKVIIEDKTYLHIKHLSHDKNKFHLKLTISSKELKKMSKLDANKKINNILKDEIKNYIHSIQILFD
jgi:Stress-induced morphogen (activity unknown)